MNLLDQIKKDQISARKEKNQKKSASLTSLLSEATMVGKNKRNGLPTNDEVIQVIKKFIKNIDETINICEKQGRDVNLFVEEKELYSNYLPKQFSSDELSSMIESFVSENNISGMKNMGSVMKWLNENYFGQFDGKEASGLVKQILSR